MFLHVPSCSLHVPFIFFFFVGCSKCVFFGGLNFVAISLDSSHVKNQFLGPSREGGGGERGGRFGPSFPFLHLFLFFPLFFFSFFSFLFISSFFFFFSFFLKKKFQLFFFLVFLSNWHKYQSLTVSSVVGAPWRCGVLTT